MPEAASAARTPPRAAGPRRARLHATPLRGIGLKVLSVAVFMLMAVCIKAASARVPPGEAVFFRALFAMPVILAWLAWTNGLRRGLRTTNPVGHIWRGLAGTAGMALGFTALGLLPLPEATALAYAAPLLTVIFAVLFLGEEARVFRMSAVLVGLLGVVVVLSPRLTLLGSEGVSAPEALGALAALLGAAFAALAQIFLRKLVHTEATPAIVFYLSLTATVLSLATLPFGWVLPTRPEAALLIGAGVFGGLGQILLTESYRHAETSVIAPFEYVSMILSLILGYLVFEELPTFEMLGGAALIVAAGLFIIWREHRLGLEQNAPSKALPPHDAAATRMIYKIFRAAEMAQFVAAGRTDGAPVDLADGFVHFSTAAQAPETAARYFADEEGLWLVACDEAGMAGALRWEPSRGGALFPHLYRALAVADVVWARPLPRSDGGRAFPPDLG